MAHAAAAALNLDLRSSWVVGDRPEDIGLAEAIGASAVFLGTAADRPRVQSAPDLDTAACLILERIAA
jgi:histidinol phosphatase-like enzyme